MKIVLKKLSLTNFKGIRKYEVEFSDGINEIVGKNGTGKTSLFDAFLWLLFGKDSTGKKDFGVKTLDADGNEIHRIEHNVTAVIEVDGKTKTLSRTLREKWQTEKGKTEEVYKGNETLYEIDSVPFIMSEYNEKISGWADEELFKLVTNPLAFVSLKTQRQREILMEMAQIGDDLSIAEANGKKSIIDIINSDKTIADKAKELAKTKSRLKKELDTIPTRIDEASRSIDTDVRPVEIIDAEISDKKGQAKVISDKLDLLKNGGARAEIKNKIRTAEIQLEQAKLAHQTEIDKKRAENSRKCAEYQQIVGEIQQKIKFAEKDIRSLRVDIEFSCGQQDKLRREFEEIRKKEFPEFSDIGCKCCGRAWDKEVLTIKRAEYEENRKSYNARRAKNLNEIREKGIGYTQTIKDCENRISALEEKSAALKAELEELQKNPVKLVEVLPFDASDYLKRIDDLTAELESEKVDTSEGEEQLSALLSEITKCRAEKLTAANNAQAEKRVAELEQEAKTKAQAIADIEREESVIEDFTKIKIDALDKAINDKFEKVKFKLYDYQINGGFTECCEPTIDGVPYSDLNGAGKINAGLDIINALQNFYSVRVPLFIDNRETVNCPFKLDCQTIYLKVVGEEQAENVKVIELQKLR